MPDIMTPNVYSIGHSNRPIEEVIELLKMHNVNAVCDVRSNPFSRFWPQYNKPELEAKLREAHISYIFLGKELGARPTDPSMYDGQGRVSYMKLSSAPNFARGIQRLQDGLRKTFVPALMCAEKDPLQCHRSILVGRHLSTIGLSVTHILGHSSTETQPELERRLLQSLKLHPDMLRGETPDTVINRAYEVQGQKIAHADDQAVEHL